MRSTWERSVPFTGKPLPAGFKTKVVVREGRKTDTASYTYGISYAGKVRFGDEIDPLVTSLTACAGSYSYPLWILACEMKIIYDFDKNDIIIRKYFTYR